MEMELRFLQCGSCEPLKLGVHAGAFGLAVVMGLYNAAAWLRRREPHLVINAVVYAALTAWGRNTSVIIWSKCGNCGRRPDPWPSRMSRRSLRDRLGSAALQGCLRAKRFGGGDALA